MTHILCQFCFPYWKGRYSDRKEISEYQIRYDFVVWYYTSCAVHNTYLWILKVCLYMMRQAARLTFDMLLRKLLCDTSIYMISSCRTQLLHLIHVAAVCSVGVLHGKLLAKTCVTQQFRSKTVLKRADCWHPGSQQLCVCCEHTQHCHFSFVVRLSYLSCTTCCVLCKDIFILNKYCIQVLLNYLNSSFVRK